MTEIIPVKPKLEDSTSNDDIRAKIRELREDGLDINPDHPNPSKAAGRNAAAELEEVLDE